MWMRLSATHRKLELLDHASGSDHLTWWSASATLTFDDDAIFNELAAPDSTWLLTRERPIETFIAHRALAAERFRFCNPLICLRVEELRICQMAWQGEGLGVVVCECHILQANLLAAISPTWYL
jgi:hypothetical protein